MNTNNIFSISRFVNFAKRELVENRRMLLWQIASLIAAITLTGLFFMSLGYKCGPPRLLYVCILIYAISLAYPSFVGMRSNHLYYGFYLLWIIYSVCGILMANYIGSVVIKHSCAKRVPIIKILNLIGEYSMEIYCIHWIVLLFI